MLTTLYIDAVTLLLPLAEPAPTLNTQAVLTFVLTKIVPIIFAVIGVGLLMNARKQRVGEVFETLLKVGIGGAVLLGGGALMAFGGGLVKLFIN